MDVSIILVNYNATELSLQCIESIYKHTTGLKFEILFVENGALQDNLSIVSQKYPKVKVLQSKENLGFGRANNLAAEIAQGKYLFLLNTDTVVLNNAVKHLHEFHESHGNLKIGALGGVLLDEDQNNGWSAGKFNTLGSIIWWYYYRLFDKKRSGLNIVSSLCLKEDQFREVDYVTGADLFINAEVFKEVGGFDPNIFLYFEDELLQWELKRLGYRNYIVGGTRIVHLEGGSAKKINGKVQNFKRIIWERSMFYYFFKIRGKLYKKWSKALYFFLVSLPLRLHYNRVENREYLKNYFKF